MTRSSSPDVLLHQLNNPYYHWVYVAIWTLLIAVCLLVSGRYITSYRGEYDEGPHLQVAALSEEGHTLYAETVANKPPLLIWWVQLAFKVGASSLTTARISILLLSLSGFVALGLLAERWWDK